MRLERGAHGDFYSAGAVGKGLEAADTVNAINAALDLLRILKMSQSSGTHRSLGAKASHQLFTSHFIKILYESS